MKKLGAIVIASVGFIVLIILVTCSSRLYENVAADEIVIIQDVIDGELHFYTEQGLKSQNFGKTTKYKKSFQHWFSVKEDQGEKKDCSIKIRFNDGGHAFISGSIRCDIPLDKESLARIHSRYGSQKAIEKELITPVIEKAVYMTGPIMSSKESYAEKRNQLISYIEDQASKGVYKTISKEVKSVDAMTEKEKTVTKVELVLDTSGNTVRTEPSPVQEFGIRLYNLSINSITYDNNVEKQIEAQQKAIMDVQTAIAEAKKAEQKAKTVEKEGEAKAAEAKWEQEKIKAKLVTEAEQRLAVAQLDRQTAEQRKQEEILKGQGEAERKKLVINADGALREKLDALIKMNKDIADAFAKRQVPTYYIESGSGSADGKGNIDAQNMQFLNALNALMVKNLGLDMTIKK